MRCDIHGGGNSLRAWAAMSLLAMLFSGGCDDSGGNCIDRGECECISGEDCPEGEDCINGECSRLIPPAPPKKGFGEACVRDSECVSGHCLPLGPGNGGVCTRRCEEQDCPQGWQCKRHVPPDARGAIDLCVQEIGNKLCHSCSVSAQCNAIGDYCLEVDGQFVCALDCNREECPQGYICSDVEVPGGFTRQCLPRGGSCDCSELTIGLTRPCSVSNEHGSCYGLQTCEQAQPVPDWGSCDAGMPQQETCNGADDDCDGLIDAEDPSVDVSGLPDDPPYPNCRKGSDSGDCTGLWVCVLGEDGEFEWQCGATDPENEVCNGRDDNCDGIADDPFIDEQGRYVHVEHCGGCGGDCRVMVPNLLTDENGQVVEDAVTCQVRAGKPVCVPRLCQPGTYAFPEYAPVTCAELISSACQPCGQNADCRISSDICVNVGEDPGTFCAQSCDPAAPYYGCSGEIGAQSCCPDNYTCESSHGGLYCVPLALSCTCNADREGDVRSCILSGAGSQMCQGEQLCLRQADGNFAWGECLPSDVVVEVCDGLDNNCDGNIDEGFVDENGVYFTDEHCAQCNVNCLARWDAEIQHAIGGCVEEDGELGCRIVACTSEELDGLGTCRTDGDCPQDAYCDSVYHHCLDSTPGECPGGICGTPCAGDDDCAHLGDGYECNQETSSCSVVIQFADLNDEEADGCECPGLAASDRDEPDVSSSFPLPGEAYVDRNCDGIDGELDEALFVWSGTDQSNGTREHPYATINQALAAFDPQVHEHILVAAGYYQENIELIEGIRLHGGYSSDFGDRDIVLYPSIIRGTEPDQADGTPGTVHASGIGNSRTVLNGFTIHGYDVNRPATAGQPGNSSYAVYIADCGSGLEIVNNVIMGGRGGSGGQGSPGASGRSGAGGGDGQDSWECPNSQDCAGIERDGGPGGSNPACPQAAGNPGARARGYDYDPQDYRTGGKNGRGGSNSVYSHSDPSQADLCKYDCQVGGSGFSCNGSDASAGDDGSAGSGGRGCTQATGSVQTGFFRARSGSGGSAGTHGDGGGGGGAGGAVINYNAYTDCTQGNPFGDLGASGGGGGGGGCRGSGGGSGGGGGGSFGVFIWFSAQPGSYPVVRANKIRRGFGGSGGAGGGGGQGGLGGQGGEGGQTVLPAWCAGSGGRGGRGGDGGAGGGGGGGCGGVSYALATSHVDDPGNPFYTGNQFENPGSSETGGAGGAGGPSPAGAAYSGTTGAQGAAGNVWTY